MIFCLHGQKQTIELDVLLFNMHGILLYHEVKHTVSMSIVVFQIHYTIILDELVKGNDLKRLENVL